MNICKWCNVKVSDENTVWYRKNLVFGYSFCSRKCATQWKDNKDSNVSSHNNNLENNSKSLEEMRNEQEQRKLLNEKHKQENIETARKTMIIIRKLIPYWKIVIPLIIIILIVAFYLNPMYGQILLYIYILLVAGSIWAYFTESKN
nr:hypothetical protein [uncultured Flavobacterium sp.]